MLMKIKTRVRYHLLAVPVLATLCTVVQSLAADYPTTVSSFSPLGYWRFNETGSSPAVQSYADSSSVGTSTAYAVGSVTNAVAGIVGNCVRPGNPQNLGSYVAASVDIPWNATINPNAPFTVECWVN